MSAKILRVGKKKSEKEDSTIKQQRLLIAILDLENNCLIWVTWFASEYFTMRLSEESGVVVWVEQFF